MRQSAVRSGSGAKQVCRAAGTAADENLAAGRSVASGRVSVCCDDPIPIFTGIRYEQVLVPRRFLELIGLGHRPKQCLQSERRGVNGHKFVEVCTDVLPDMVSLTPREYAVAMLSRFGMTAKEIAYTFGIDNDSVHWHRRQICTKRDTNRLIPFQ